jgi:hypothetical protein
VTRDRALYYRRGYKYQTTQDYHIRIAGIVDKPVMTQFVTLDTVGHLIIRAGYAWDGASGPTWDSRNSMIGSLVHDVLYQLIRLGLINPRYKEYADQLLCDICVEDGMFSIRASFWRWAVLNFGAGSCRPSAEPNEEVAP